jgi:hypothetical protein
MKNKIIIVIILILQVYTVSAQKRKANRAYDFFKSGEYYEAIDQFKTLIQGQKTRSLRLNGFHGG